MDNEAETGMGSDILISYESALNYNVKKKNFIKCWSNSKGNKVTLLPKVRHTEWTNTVGLKQKSIIVGVVVGVCVFIAVCIVLICICCCCGCCVACGCGRKKAFAYQHMEPQPAIDATPLEMLSNENPLTPVPPNQYLHQQDPIVQPDAQPDQFQEDKALSLHQMGDEPSLDKT